MGQGYVPNSIDKARDELFSHIRRCGVLEAEDEQRAEWFDDTIEFLGERYPELTPDELGQLRTIGERYCAPAIPHGGNGAADVSKRVASGEIEAEAEEVVDSGEVSAV